MTQTSLHAKLRQTPLHRLHVELGARMVPFAGYDMPLQYKHGILHEHLHTRSAAGLFDVSHMGQLILRPRSGDARDAARELESLVPVDVLGLAEDRQRYALFTNAAGGILDDLMVANRGDHLFLVVNAACKEADEAQLRAHLTKDYLIEPVNRALLALQGPAAEVALARLTPDIAAMRFMDSRIVSVLGSDCIVSRSGYTGEDGFEISVAIDRAEDLARALLENPAVAPIGLGARDSLRLEAGLCLYGADLDANDSNRSGARVGSSQKPPAWRRAARRLSGRGDYIKATGVGRAAPPRRAASRGARAGQRGRQDIFRCVIALGNRLRQLRCIWS